MMFLEPAGREGNGGDSAESSVRARAEGGPVGNTCGTVCELLAAALCRGGAIRLQKRRAVSGA